jgi:hypothetical protein
MLASMSDQSKALVNYADWKQIAGYFDGDGCVLIKIRKFGLIFYLQWVDAYRPQLDQITSFFLTSKKIPNRIYSYPEQDAFSFRITRMRDVLTCAERMAPWTFKKRRELQVVIEFYHNKMTANEAARIMNEQVRSGCRSGKLLNVQLPFTYKEGKRLGRRSGLTDAQLREIRIRHELPGASSYRLSSVYGVSATTIRDILKY